MNYGHWKYMVVKGWLHRVQTFRSEATTIEEIQAWDKVELWMKTLIGRPNRKLNRNGAIAISGESHSLINSDKEGGGT
jgi:hypothetical protein